MSLNLLTLPLSGRQVIEASAGTGKTFTLAALYVRLVLGHGRESPGLQPAQILVMTFTDAATAELRERIRHRLHESARWFDRQVAGRASSQDPFLESLTHSFAPEQWPHCAAQLHMAAQSMDEAAIYTIHGWSRRMLSSFALHSRDLFEQTHLDNPNELLHQLVNDHWRRWFYPLTLKEQTLVRELIGSDPQALLQELKKRWHAMDKKPAPFSAPSEPSVILGHLLGWHEQLEDVQHAARSLWTPEMATVLSEAQATKKIRGPGISKINFNKWVNSLAAWAERGEYIKPDDLARFTLTNLQEKNWAEASEHPLFAHIELLCKYLTTKPDSRSTLLDHAAFEVRQQYQQTKLQLSVFDFQDLLQRLHTALHADEGELAAAIRAQYPVAMVDEFQDTDPWQYESLDRIYDRQHVNDQHALVMIGDPKQAIYSFRGADLSTYLKARQTALEINPYALHSLDNNFRSTPTLVEAVNHIFASIDKPFYSKSGAIEFTKVDSRSDAIPLTNALAPSAQALTVLYLPNPENNQHWSVPLYTQTMSQAVAAKMVSLLHQHKDIQPSHMAVLVRTHVQAKAMQKALQKLGLPSVFMSDHANVFQTDEAQDLWRVLRAISAPRQTSWLRSAVASSMWGFDIPQLQTFLKDDAQSDALAESCHRWLQQWQQQGLLPMLYSWMHEQGIAQRLLLLPQGERRLTNLLHLGELLQNASQRLQGPAALMQYLADQIQSSSDSPEAQKMRLETDDQCVQIVTYHKSKGLEYPFVFVPFLGSFKKPPNDDPNKNNKWEEDGDEPDVTESNVDEDMRLLYVALTRAKRGLWLGLASCKDSLAGSAGNLRLSAVSRLLKRESHSDLFEKLQKQWGNCSHIEIENITSVQGETYQAPRASTLPQAALVPKRLAHQRWWTASFSSLTRGLEAGTAREEALLDADRDAQTDTSISNSKAAVSVWQSFPAGASYGSLLHDLLEWQAKQAWPLAQTHPLPWQSQAWLALKKRKSDWLQLPGDAQALLDPWITGILSTPLPLTDAQHHHELAAPVCLHSLQEPAIWPEMEFSISASGVRSAEVDNLIRQHVFPAQARPTLLPQLMRGMLTGFMDLVFEHDGRYWVLDYKSNKLPDYQASQVLQAVLEKRYDVQYVLYILALHRLLKSRLPNYRYDNHVGGAVYVFLRGIDVPNAGVHALRPPFQLIDELDQLFAGVVE